MIKRLENNGLLTAMLLDLAVVTLLTLGAFAQNSNQPSCSQQQIDLSDAWQKEAIADPATPSSLSWRELNRRLDIMENCAAFMGKVVVEHPEYGDALMAPKKGAVGFATTLLMVISSYETERANRFESFIMHHGLMQRFETEQAKNGGE
jgi:hypothetical protein